LTVVWLFEVITRRPLDGKLRADSEIEGRPLVRGGGAVVRRQPTAEAVTLCQSVRRLPLGFSPFDGDPLSLLSREGGSWVDDVGSRDRLVLGRVPGHQASCFDLLVASGSGGSVESHGGLCDGWRELHAGLRMHILPEKAELTTFAATFPWPLVLALARFLQAADAEIGIGTADAAPDDFATEHPGVASSVSDAVVDHPLRCIGPFGGRRAFASDMQNRRLEDDCLHTLHHSMSAFFLPKRLVAKGVRV